MKRAGDRTLKCRACGELFVYPRAQQVYIEARGFQEPRRCRACRVVARKYWHAADGKQAAAPAAPAS